LTGAPALLLDLGDLFTKGLLLAPPAPPAVLRFPSAVAHALIGTAAGGADELLLGGPGAMVRPAGFDPMQAPRARSYPGADAFLRQARAAPRTRLTLAGWLAAAYGADRTVLGEAPSPAVLEPLTQKALIASRASPGVIDLTFVVDSGIKAQVTAAFAAEIAGEMTIATGTFRAPRGRGLRFSLRPGILDAPACAAAALPPDVCAAGGTLLVDVGYFRTKLAVVGPEGCALQRDHEGLGLADCVRRVLRDAQEQGLVEDEFAVIRALETARRVLTIAGRTFDVGAILDRAVADLAHAVSGVARQALADDFDRRGTPCAAAAILGGGTPLAGAAIAAHLREAGLGLRVLWLTPDPSFFLLGGARRLRGRGA
jgi:hypothetical protein